MQHKHNIRREKRKKNDKIDESSKIERMDRDQGMRYISRPRLEHYSFLETEQQNFPMTRKVSKSEKFA